MDNIARVHSTLGQLSLGSFDSWTIILGQFDIPKQYLIVIKQTNQKLAINTNRTINRLWRITKNKWQGDVSDNRLRACFYFLLPDAHRTIVCIHVRVINLPRSIRCSIVDRTTMHLHDWCCCFLLLLLLPLLLLLLLLLLPCCCPWCWWWFMSLMMPLLLQTPVLTAASLLLLPCCCCPLAAPLVPLLLPPLLPSLLPLLLVVVVVLKLPCFSFYVADPTHSSYHISLIPLHPPHHRSLPADTSSASVAPAAVDSSAAAADRR